MGTGRLPTQKRRSETDEPPAAVHPQRRGALDAKDLSTLEKLAAANLPPSVISLRLGRPEPAILTKAVQVGITLTPLNRPPYGG